jgi:hypothetical protein
MASWVLVYYLLVPSNSYFTRPVITYHFDTGAQCEAKLAYIDQTYKQANITGNGYCWSTSK